MPISRQVGLFYSLNLRWMHNFLSFFRYDPRSFMSAHSYVLRQDSGKNTTSTPMYTKKSDLPFIIDDQTFSKFFLFLFIFETSSSSDCVLTYIMSETRHGWKLLFDCIYCIYVIQWYIESCKMLFIIIWKKVDAQKTKKQKKGGGGQHLKKKGAS